MLQTDGWNCGPWVLTVDESFIAYMDSSDFGKGVFGIFMTSWFGERARGVVDLRTLASRGAARGKAVQANITFINSERDRMRALLFSAAMDEKLPYNDGPILDVFIANGGKEATAEELDALDMIEVD